MKVEKSEKGTYFVLSKILLDFLKIFHRTDSKSLRRKNNKDD